MNPMPPNARDFITAYRALPEKVQAEVRQFILNDAPRVPAGIPPGRKSLTDFLRASPVRIPEDFRFIREEANER
jgi:hypothetical protein